MTPALVTEPRTLPDGKFEQRAAEVLLRLRAALSALVSAVPAPQIGSAADLQRALGVRTTLAWQIYRLARSTDPLADAAGMPGSAAMSRFLEAAAARGVPADRILDAASASKEFNALIKTHARDRSAFDSMLSAMAGNGSDQIDLQHRRAAFKANSHILGLQTDAQLNCHMFARSDNSDCLDFVAIRGLIGLTWIRQNAACMISSLKVSDNDNVVRRPFFTEHLDPSTNVPKGVGLLTNFCSRPFPQIQVSEMPSGLVNTELIGNSVGRQSAATYLVGHRIACAGSVYKAPNQDLHRSIASVTTPSRVLIHDMLIEDGLFDRIDPIALAYIDHRGVDYPLSERACDLLPLDVSVSYLGKGPSALHTPDVPRYAEMVEYACGRLKWAAANLHVYRCRLQFPVMPSSVAVQFELPKKPVDS